MFVSISFHCFWPTLCSYRQITFNSNHLHIEIFWSLDFLISSSKRIWSKISYSWLLCHTNCLNFRKIFIIVFICCCKFLYFLTLFIQQLHQLSTHSCKVIKHFFFHSLRMGVASFPPVCVCAIWFWTWSLSTCGCLLSTHVFGFKLTWTSLSGGKVLALPESPRQELLFCLYAQPYKC